MVSRRQLTGAAFVMIVTVGAARADCPTNIRDLPPTGFLASATELVLVQELRQPPPFAARIGATGGVRAEGEDGGDAEVVGTAGIGGELRVHKQGTTGCVSADLVDVRDMSVHATAMGQVPFFFTGLGAGVTIDRDITLPLSARPEFYRAPISRIAAQFSMAFLDFSVTDTVQNHLRMSVMPVMVEEAYVQQDTETIAFERRTSRFDTTLLRFASSDANGATGNFDVFGVEVEWSEAANARPITTGVAQDDTRGFARVSLVSLDYDGPTWGFVLDGGALGLAGPVDCKRVDCGKGWLRASLTRKWDQWSVEGGLDRDAFLGADDLPVLENRATVGAAAASGNTRVSAHAFVADTFSWLEHEGGQRAGLRATLSHALAYGFSAALDSELVRSNAEMQDLGSGARLLLSLAYQRASSAR